MKNVWLSYAFDPLCGWCFGFIPVLERLRELLPDLRIDVCLGGLITGDRVKPYRELAPYIDQVAERMTSVTNQSLSSQFFKKILGSRDIVASSIPASWVILQVRNHRPEIALDFAHLVQKAHFGSGADLNDPKTYTNLLRSFSLPEDFALPSPNIPPPSLAAEFAATRAKGGNSFPTIFVHSQRKFVPVPTIYNASDLLGSIKQVMAQI